MFMGEFMGKPLKVIVIFSLTCITTMIGKAALLLNSKIRPILKNFILKMEYFVSIGLNSISFQPV